MSAVSDVVIDAPTVDDIPAIAELIAEDLQDLRLPIVAERQWETARRLVQEQSASLYVRVARLVETPADGEGAHPAAAGLLVAHRRVSVKFCGDAYWIETLLVGDSLRRRGIGRRLVAGLMDHATVTGAGGIDLEAYRMNAPASYLYRALGFRRLGRERYSISLH
ncbi:MAG: GNAT family N-acetyltransferase [Myxococcales bacterium]|nr:GNAT family N-acetyltransferase [Myxococcales bacterium]